ncbi:hypothetical protein CALCODRAFT_552587 [Calocera cornea HHB12733]|uniref:Uncharacterized protein n=1 Tax=Calocera cornea HHB12733 TaxID=1353952 RepID=A0A165K1R3_9BASI|nr:hypothetical protein CALCODRAFT_552587 [Calocera cornea HHB12733]
MVESPVCDPQRNSKVRMEATNGIPRHQSASMPDLGIQSKSVVTGASSSPSTTVKVLPPFLRPFLDKVRERRREARSCEMKSRVYKDAWLLLRPGEMASNCCETGSWHRRKSKELSSASSWASLARLIRRLTGLMAVRLAITWKDGEIWPTLFTPALLQGQQHARCVATNHILGQQNCISMNATVPQYAMTAPACRQLHYVAGHVVPETPLVLVLDSLLRHPDEEVIHGGVVQRPATLQKQGFDGASKLQLEVPIRFQAAHNWYSVRENPEVHSLEVGSDDIVSKTGLKAACGCTKEVSKESVFLAARKKVVEQLLGVSIPKVNVIIRKVERKVESEADNSPSTSANELIPLAGGATFRQRKHMRDEDAVIEVPSVVRSELEDVTENVVRQTMDASIEREQLLAETLDTEFASGSRSTLFDLLDLAGDGILVCVDLRSKA